MKRIVPTCMLLLCVIVSRGQWSYTSLIEPKAQHTATSLGNKVYFAGGASYSNYLSDVEVYDVNTGQWTYHNLTQARQLLTSVTCGSKVFFAGGTRIGYSEVYNTVDIYDTLTQQWTTANLSQPRFLITAVAHGNKVLFAGGINPFMGIAHSIVDIYDIQADTWTSAQLSVARSTCGAVVGDLALFGGGADLTQAYDVVDIYNFTTGDWSTTQLSLARGYIAATTVGNKVLFAGGMTDMADSLSATSLVDIYDASAGTWGTSSMSSARVMLKYGATVGHKAYFAGGGNFYGQGGTWKSSSKVIDIYDDITGAWSVDSLTHKVMNHTVTAAGNKLFVSGGANANMIPMVAYSTVEIYTDPTVGLYTACQENPGPVVFPNPNAGQFSLKLGSLRLPAVATIFTLQGREVFSRNLTELEQSMDVSLPAGVYLLQVTAGKARQTIRLMAK